MKIDKFGLILPVLLACFIATCPAVAQPEGTLTGCEGENCGCFADYRKTSADDPDGSPKPYDIPVAKSFTLYTNPDTASFVIQKVEPGAKARPVEQFIQFVNKGKYVVQAVESPQLGLKAGDIVDSRIDDGEGLIRINHQGKWIGFDSTEQEVTLKTVTETKTEDWLAVEVDGKKGFTLDKPFALCSN